MVKLGYVKGKRYHFALLIVAFITMLLFTLKQAKEILQFLPLLAFIPIGIHFISVYHIKKPSSFDPELKKLALSTFLLAVLTYISYNKFL